MLKISSNHSGNDSERKKDEEKQLYQTLDQFLTAGDLVFEEFSLGCRESLSRLLRKRKYDFILFQASNDSKGQSGIELNMKSNQKVFLPLNELANEFPNDRPPFLVLVKGFKGMDQKEVGEIFTKQGIAKTLVFIDAEQTLPEEKMVSEFFKELFGRMRQDSIAAAVEESLAFVGLDSDSQPSAFLASSFTLGEKIVFQEETEDKHPLFNIQEAAEPSAAPVGSQRFIGRWDVMAQAENSIQNGLKAIGICGASGLGKTFFVHELGAAMLTTRDEALAVEKIFFLDGRSDSGGLYGDLIDQLEKLFHRFSEKSLSEIIRNQRDYSAPKEKAQALAEAIAQRQLLFVFDNFESYLDDDNCISDSLLKDFIETLIKSSGPKSKFLFAAKNQAVFSDEIAPTWISLNPFSSCERLAFLNSFQEFNALPFDEKWEIAEICHGIPFDLNLFAHNAGTKVERRVILKKLREENIPDFFLGELAKNRLELLKSRALFLDNSLASPMLEAFWQTLCEEQKKDPSGFSADIKALSQKRMFVPTKEPGDEMLRFFVHPVLRDRFLNSSDSRFSMSEAAIKDRYKLNAEFYYALFYAQLKTDPKSAFSYLSDCLVYAVLGGSGDDVAEFLEIFLDGYQGHVSGGRVWTLFERVARIFLGQKDNASFVDLVRKMASELVKPHPILAERLFTEWYAHPLADSKEKVLSHKTLGQLNLKLGNFENALENFNKYISCDYPDIEKNFGNIYRDLGKANQYLCRRQEAIDSFRKSIEWNEKLDELKKLGETYRLIGNIYNDLKEWDSAIESYELAMQSDEKLEDESGVTESHLCLGYTNLQKESWNDALKSFATALERGKKYENMEHVESAYNGLADTCAGQDQLDQMKGLLLMAVEAIAPSKSYQVKRSITLENIKSNRVFYNDSDWDSLKENLPKDLVESLKSGSFKSKR